MNYRGKKCLVVGAALSGMWAARLLLDRGAAVTISDRRSAAELAGIMDSFANEPVTWETGEHRPATFLKSDLIVLSPGVPRTIPALAGAVRKGRPVIGEMELAARELRVPLAAITGSNGKTTTTALLGHICGQCGLAVFVGGNIGRPLSQFILEGQKAEAAVAEVSSFQLETVEIFHARAAACLNVTPDHLDRYTDMAEYFRTKTRIFDNQRPEDLAVFNGDDLLLRHKNLTARAFVFSRSHKPAFGAWVNRGRVVVLEEGRVTAERPWADFSLWGVHNQENLMAATGLALGLGLPAQKALDAAAGFKVDGHRLELAGEWDGVKYYDDSKGTNVGAVAAALANFREKVVLIMGGQGKGQDFRPLSGVVAEKVRRLVLIGEAKNELAKALGRAAPVTLAGDMAEAVAAARRAAGRAGVVLLSPGCASFDMFKDYRERGEIFSREARRQHSGN